MGVAVNDVNADAKLRTAHAKISRALLRLNAIKPGNEAGDGLTCPCTGEPSELFEASLNRRV